VTDIVAPIVVAMSPETWPGSVVRACQPDVCAFYRHVDDALAAMRSGSSVFDGRGQRLVVADGQLRVSPTNPDARGELSELLECWLGYMDAIRGSVAGTPLPDLIRLCVEHAAECGLYR
jgi:hypothetical protein